VRRAGRSALTRLSHHLQQVKIGNCRGPLPRWLAVAIRVPPRSADGRGDGHRPGLRTPRAGKRHPGTWVPMCTHCPPDDRDRRRRTPSRLRRGPPVLADVCGPHGSTHGAAPSGEPGSDLEPPDRQAGAQARDPYELSGIVAARPARQLASRRSGVQPAWQLDPHETWTYLASAPGCRTETRSAFPEPL
jgi:hypothetical protein